MRPFKKLQPSSTVCCVALLLCLSGGAWAADPTPTKLVHDIDRGDIPLTAQVRIQYTWDIVHNDGVNRSHKKWLTLPANKQSMAPQIWQARYQSIVPGPNGTTWWSVPFAPGSTNQKLLVKWWDGRAWQVATHTETKTELSQDKSTKRVYIELAK